MVNKQYNVNIATAHHNDEAGKRRKSSVVMVDNTKTNKVEQSVEVLIRKRCNLFSSEILERFFNW